MNVLEGFFDLFGEFYDVNLASAAGGADYEIGVVGGIQVE